MTAADFPPAPDEREPEAQQSAPAESAGGMPTVNIGGGEAGGEAGNARNYSYTPPLAGPSYAPPTPPAYPQAQQYSPPPAYPQTHAPYPPPTYTPTPYPPRLPSGRRYSERRNHSLFA